LIKLKDIYLLKVLIIGLILFNGCTERIDIELDSTYTRLVVFGEITSENKYQTIKLSASSDYFYNQAAPIVSDALVEVFTDSTTYIFDEDPEIPGLYISQFPFGGQIGKTYNLRIENIDIDQNGELESYTASSTTPSIGILDSISISYYENPFVSGYRVSMYAFDPPTKEWYNYKMLKNGVLLNDTLIKFSVQPDDFFNGQYVFGFPVGFLSDSTSSEAAFPGDTITFELNSITRDYYDFIVSAQSEIFGSNPMFGGPPANVKTNLDKGALGVFTSSTFLSVSDSIRVE
jgi:hypothetical protein